MPLYGVVLVLPDSIEKRLDKMRSGFTQHMQYINIPHISLYPFSAEAEVKKTLESKFATIAADTNPFTLELTEVGFFEAPWNVAYVSVSKNQHFCQLHSAIYNSIQVSTEHLDWTKLYDPDTIVPHVTIGEGIPPDVLQVMKTELSGCAFNIKETISSFVILGKDGNGEWRINETFPFRKLQKSL
jgi:2'-5' RNA ligase